MKENVNLFSILLNCNKDIEISSYLVLQYENVMIPRNK